MKILFCTNFYNSTHNGVAQFSKNVELINKHFPRHDLRIASLDLLPGQLENKNYLYRLQFKSSKSFYGLGQISNSFKLYKAILKIKEEFDFDILFFNNIFNGLYYTLKPIQNVKVIGFLHDEKYMSSYPKISTWKVKEALNIFFHFLEKNIIKKLDMVLVNSKHLKNRTVNSYSISAEKVKIIHLAINFELFPFGQPKSINVNNPIKILFVKNAYIGGGLIDLINATNILKNTYTFELTIVGPFNTEKNQILNLFNNSKTKPIFLGPQTNEEIKALMDSHDILCIPSHRETLGIANIEGLATGIPVVTTNVGGIPEVTNNDQCAWIANPCNPKSLASQIDQCIKQEKNRIQKSIHGRNHVESNFKLENMLNGLANIFDYLNTRKSQGL